MKAVIYFENLLSEGIVKKQNPDKSRAEFLKKEAEKSKIGLDNRIEKIGIDDNSANSIIKDCHDIFMELIRAKMLLEGYNCSGYRAHEAEVSYLRNLGFDENDVQFADQIRYFRNGMLYYGTILDKEYADKVVEFLKRIYEKLI